jgi:drug/metabolite transporter (DMT)-like permease
VSTSTTSAPAAVSRSWLPPFLILAAVWGCSFVFIKLSVAEFSPLQVALGRVLVGALVLCGWLAVTRDRLPRGRTVWLHLGVVSLLANTLPFTLFAYGEQHITSVLAGIWNATTPLMTLVVVLAALPAERPTWQRLAGLGTGFAGVLVVLGAWRGIAGDQLLGNLACLAAAACYGLAFPYVKRFLSVRDESAAALAAGQLLAATAVLGVACLLFTGAPGAVSAKGVGSLLALGALGTGIAYVLAYRLVELAGATTSSTVTYVIPVFSTAAGVVVLSEPLSWNQPVGALVVLAGIAVSRVGSSPTSPPAPTDP